MLAIILECLSELFSSRTRRLLSRRENNCNCPNLDDMSHMCNIHNTLKGYCHRNDTYPQRIAKEIDKI